MTLDYYLSKMLDYIDEALQLPSSRELINEVNWNSPAIVLTGPRGVGKTTLMIQATKRQKLKPIQDFLYINGYDLVMRQDDLEKLVKEYFRTYGNLILIDEIHKVPHWGLTLRGLIDTSKSQKIVVSGSSEALISKGIAEADIQRRIDHEHLKDLSFREFLNIEMPDLNLKKITLDDIVKKHIQISTSLKRSLIKTKILNQFQNYLIYGAYPFYRESLRGYHRRLEENINRIIEKDIVIDFDLKKGAEIDLKKTLFQISTSQKDSLNKSSLAVATGLTRVTLDRYLKHLNNTSLTIELRADRSKTTNKPDKIMIANVNILKILLAKRKITDIGSYRETFFVSQIPGNLDLYCVKAVKQKSTPDFYLNNYLFEVGGKSKNRKQVTSEGFLVQDGIEIGTKQSIPLYLFGFLR